MHARLREVRNKAVSRSGAAWHWSAVTVNRGYEAACHVDGNNLGPSIIRSWPNPEDTLWYWPDMCARDIPSLDASSAVRLDIGVSGHLHTFDGNCPHMTAAVHSNIHERFSIIFFQTRRGWNAPRDVISNVRRLGFNPASSEREARTFAQRYDALTDGSGHASWPLTSALS